MTNKNWDFLNYEADIVEDWPKELQSLVDKRLVKVEYDENNKGKFSLTKLGYSIYKEIGIEFN